MTPERRRQIEELYQAAIQLKRDERAALLAHADQDVRNQVEAMLAQSAGPNLLDHSAWANAAEPSAALPLAPGVQLGQYTIETELGAGGMGTVFRAVDSK